MRILIAGACGFIGTNLSLRLLTDGHQIIGVDNFCTGSKSNCKILKTFHNFVMYEQSIENFNYENQINYIIHLASPASPPKYLQLPLETISANTVGTINLLKLANKNKCPFLFASTSEIYGDPLVHPQQENYFGNVNPCSIRSVYDESKRMGETITHYFAQQNNIAKIIRIFNTYGPFMQVDDGRVISNLVCQALRKEKLTIYGSGEQTRSFQYIDDLIDGIVKFMFSNHLGPINLGNPDEFTVMQLAQEVEKLLGSYGYEYKPLPISDPARRKPDISLAKKILNWKPKINLQDGLKKTIPYFKDCLYFV